MPYIPYLPYIPNIPYFPNMPYQTNHTHHTYPTYHTTPPPHQRGEGDSTRPPPHHRGGGGWQGLVHIYCHTYTTLHPSPPHTPHHTTRGEGGQYHTPTTPQEGEGDSTTPPPHHRGGWNAGPYIYIYIYIYIIYVCVYIYICVCVCVCARTCEDILCGSSRLFLSSGLLAQLLKPLRDANVVPEVSFRSCHRSFECSIPRTSLRSSRKMKRNERQW